MSEYITFNTENNLVQQSSFKCSGYGLGALIQNMNNPIGLEIGSDVGDTANFLLDSNQSLFLNSVDPYSNYLDWNGRMLNEREEIYQSTMKRLSAYSNRFKQHRMTSDQAASTFSDEYFDFVFIDGLHTYEQLTLDCQNYYSKVKPGGLFAGHDYNVIPGVNKAVNEFAQKMGKEILETECDVWYWYK